MEDALEDTLSTDSTLIPTPANCQAIPLSIYLHWPWCVRKCPYCDFNSHAAPKRLAELEGPYIDGLLRDLEGWLPDAEGRAIHSIFIGGGTPSLMSPGALERLLSGIRARFPLETDCEITLEANPGTVDAERFRAFRAAGVNRLSIGVQSFSNERLQRLGRIHDVACVEETLVAARETFENFNLDVMYALPGETLETLKEEIDAATESGATHLSFYQLTIEPGTAFAKCPPEDLPDPDLAAEMGDLVEEQLAQKHFTRYEVSGYAQPGRRCRHNLNYWTFGDYLAAGAGAHGKLSTSRGIRREARRSSPVAWLKALSQGNPQDALESSYFISREDMPFEFMLNTLRLLDGVPTEYFTARTGLPLEVIAHQVNTLREQGLLVDDSQRIQPTRRGLDFLSDLQEAFL